jgi:UPF0716 protein FxsA
MLPLFLVFFFALPVIELFVLIQVGGELGAFPTIFLVLLTAVVGIWLVRRQGMGVIARIRKTADRGETPAAEMIEGALLLLAGLCLLVPGFVTDLTGFALLIPPLRRIVLIGVVRRIRVVERPVSGEQPHSRRSAIETTWEREKDG